MSTSKYFQKLDEDIKKMSDDEYKTFRQKVIKEIG